MADVIVAEGLTKYYGKQRGVIDLRFAVAAGEVFGYLGPNGAGKTTTIRTTLDFIRPTSGRISVFGLDSRSDSLAIHRRVGYLPGEFGLYENLTGEDFLRHLGSLRGGMDEAYVRELAERIDLDLSQRIKALSHGNKQKVGLVQAFMHRPDLLVLDEPTLGLDPLIQQEFYALIAEGRELGRTVFLSSHILPEIERVCDRVAIIRSGRLMDVDSVAALKSRAIRSVEIDFAGPAPTDAFARLPGVEGVTAQNDRVRFTVKGSMDPIVKTAARYEIDDFVATEPSLEEIFLTFYGEETNGETASASQEPTEGGGDAP